MAGFHLDFKIQKSKVYYTSITSNRDMIKMSAVKKVNERL